MSLHCENCRWFVPTPIEPDDEYGDCRLYPPVIPLFNRESVDRHNSEYPKVHGLEDWCGQYRTKHP